MKHIKIPFVSFFSKKAGQGKAHHSRSLDEEVLDMSACPHNNYCNIKSFLNKAHCSLDFAKTCQTFKFYQKYGEKYNQMFV